MAATIGTWTGFTNGSDPTGSLTIDAGSNRKFVVVVMGETDLGSLSITFTVGGQAPSETKTSDIELGSGAADIAIRAFVFDESTIAAMSGTTVSWADGVTWSKISWGYVTIQGTSQSATDSDSDSSSSATSVTITWPTTTDSNGIVVALGVANSANRAPIGFAVTSRLQYGDGVGETDYAAGVGDGAGGGGVATSMAITNDEAANSGLAGMGLWFPQGGGVQQKAMYHYRNHGVI